MLTVNTGRQILANIQLERQAHEVNW